MLENIPSTVTTDAQLLSARIRANEELGARDLTQWALGLLSPRLGEHILDVGCGIGKLLVPLAERVGPGGNVVGLDLSEAALQEARRLAQDRGASVELVHGKMEEVARLFQGRRFDVILSCYALYYSADPGATIGDLVRLLAPGGRLLVISPYKGNNEELLALLAQGGATPATPVRDTFMDEVVLPQCRRLFGRVESFPFENPVTFPSAEVLFQYWKSTAYYHPNLEAFVLEAARGRIQREGRFVVSKRALGVLASGLEATGRS